MKSGQNLTKQGTPRKRAPGAGRPSAGRTVTLPRVSPAVHAVVKAAAEAGGSSLADEVERRLLGKS